MSKNNPGPDFIGIGAQKAGTSWLFRRLEELPEFALPPVKEIHYFDRSRNYDSPHTLAHSNILLKLINHWWLKNLRRRLIVPALKNEQKHYHWYKRYFFSTYNDNFYLNLFKELEGIKGEVSPSYSLLDPEDIRKMHELLPNVKLILLLRDPIDRAWSHYNYVSPKDKVLDINHFESFINSIKQEKRSDYIRVIDNYLKYYPKNQLFVGFFDHIKSNPQDLLEKVVYFLGGNVDPITEFCNLDRKDNVNSQKIKIPKEFMEILKNKYRGLFEQLDKEFGDCATAWKTLYFG